jgi:hypothetical protein
VFQDRVRLSLESSFTGKDLLTVRLAASSTTRLQLPKFPNNAQGNQTFNLPAGNGNDIVLDWLAYEFPVGDLYVYIPAYSGRWWDFAPTLNPVIGGGTNGESPQYLRPIQSRLYPRRGFGSRSQLQHRQTVYH